MNDFPSRRLTPIYFKRRYGHRTLFDHLNVADTPTIIENRQFPVNRRYELIIRYPLRTQICRRFHTASASVDIHTLLAQFFDILKTVYEEEDRADPLVIDIERVCNNCKTKTFECDTVGSGECCICMEETDQPDYIQLGCKHIFHRPCITSWLTKKNQCPLCRTAIVRCDTCQGTGKFNEMTVISELPFFQRPSRPPTFGPYQISGQYLDELLFSCILWENRSSRFYIQPIMFTE
jgi:hypothetical protein